jgi:hypothetical protein
MQRLALFVLLGAGACAKPAPVVPESLSAPAAVDPVAYNDQLIDEQTKIGQSILAFTNVMNGEDLSGLEPARLVLVRQIEGSIAVASAMPPVDGSTELRDAAVSLFSFYLRTAQQEYRRFVEILADGAVTESEAAESEGLIAAVTAGEAQADQAFEATQVAFAAKYSFELTENEELQQALDGEP